jgi:DNA-binding beta-propeller fold protein YncE
VVSRSLIRRDGTLGQLPVPLLALLLAVMLPVCARAQIAVSGNDGKQLAPGDPADTRTTDNVVIIDISTDRPRVLSTLAAPASMIGPPTSVAVAPDESFAIVTAAQALEGDVVVTNDSVSVLDLTDPAAPRVVQTLRAGPGASGVAINRAATLALVASTGEDAITVFSIAGRRLTRAGTLRLPYQSRPTDVAFSPDGTTALVVTQAAGKIIRLTVDGTSLTHTGIAIAPGLLPYGIIVTREGRFAINTNLGGRLPPANTTSTAIAGAASPTIGTVTLIDLTSNEVVDTIDVGVTPEHVTLSPDGRFVAVVVLNGSNAAPHAPGYQPEGLIQVYRLDGASLIKVAQAASGPWCQGAVWSGDGETLLVQGALAREIEVYRFDGTSLVRDLAATTKLTARPGALATAFAR